MTKLIATGDDHFDCHTRWEECLRVHGWIAELVERERPDVFTSGGDIYERASTPLERQAVADWLTRIAEVCPVVIAKGNHDRDLDCAFLARLASRHPIIVEERAGVHVVNGIAIATVAWPNRSELLRAAGYDGAAVADSIASTALRNVLLGLGAEMRRHKGPRVLLGHFMIDGSVTSTGQPLVGHAMNVGLADLGLVRADITIAGHIHAAQAWEFDGRPILYTGSPFRTSFGEMETKSVVVAEWDEADVMTWRRVETPATPMIHMTAHMVDSECMETGDDIRILSIDDIEIQPEDLTGAEVRFRYHVPADERERGRQQAHGWKANFERAGAVSVQVEEVVIPTTTARAPEVAAAIGLAEKLAALWENRGTTPNEERARELVRKATSLETAA